jgi:putative addiction module CopG family antidote
MTLNVSLPKELVEHIDAEVGAGRYASSNDLIRAAVEMLLLQDESLDADLDRLRKAWKDGVESADFSPLDAGAVKAEGRKILIAQKA